MLRIVAIAALVLAVTSHSAVGRDDCLRRKVPPIGTFSVRHLERLLLRIWLTEWSGRVMDVPQFFLTGPLCDTSDIDVGALWLNPCTPVKVVKHEEDHVKVSILKGVDHNRALEEAKKIADTNDLSNYSFKKEEFVDLMKSYRSHFSKIPPYKDLINTRNLRFYGKTYPYLEDRTSDFYLGCRKHALPKILKSNFRVHENAQHVDIYFNVGWYFFGWRP